MRRHLFTPIAILLLATSGLLAAGCSSETKDKAGDAVESAKDDAAKGADTAQARTVAESLRTSLKGNGTADKEGIRSVKAINEAAADLPGDTKTSGVDDADGDGMDDDGKVQVDVDEQHACLTLPESGEDTEVSGGEC